MAEFDPVKAMKEELSGLVEIKLALLRRERQVAAQYGELEVELNNIVKLRGFADAEIDRKRTVLKQLEEANAIG